ncbi:MULTISPECIES: hypothetical protein [unclassified Marinovum]
MGPEPNAVDLGVRYPTTDPSYNKLDPARIFPDAYLSTATGLPVTDVNPARYMTDFMYVKGVTFIASNVYGTGPMLAYDEDQAYLGVVPNTDEGQTGKYVLPADTVYVRASGLNAGTVYMYLDDFSRFGTRYEYGVTEDSIKLTETNAAVATKARLDYVKTLNIVDGLNVLDPDSFAPGFTINGSGVVIASATNSVSEFLYCKGRSFASTNMFFYGGIYAYDEDYGFISSIARNTETGFFDIPGTAYYIRGTFLGSNNGEQYLVLG